MDDLKKFAKNTTSQNGEDGITEELLRRLGIDGGWMFECGAWDGEHLSNAFSFRDRFKILAVEGDPDKYRDLLVTAVKNPAIVPVNAWLKKDEDTIGTIVRLHGISDDEFAMMSIDIDSHDYDSWNVTTVRPAIVIIEINSSSPPGVRGIYPDPTGTTFTSMLDLGIRKGYTLVTHTGNMMFVRDDLVHKLNIDVSNPDTMFCMKWIRPTPS